MDPLEEVLVDEETARYMDVAVPEEMAFRRLLRSIGDHESLVEAHHEIQRSAQNTRHRSEMIVGYVELYRQNAGSPKVGVPTPARKSRPVLTISPQQSSPKERKAHGKGSTQRSPQPLAPLRMSDAQRRTSIGLTSSRSVTSAVSEDLVAEIRQKAALALAERRTREQPTGRILDWSDTTPSKVLGTASKRHSLAVSFCDGDGGCAAPPMTCSVGLDAPEFADGDDDELEAFYSDED